MTIISATRPVAFATNLVLIETTDDDDVFSGTRTNNSLLSGQISVE
jgi:hypothetical protein